MAGLVDTLPDRIRQRGERLDRAGVWALPKHRPSIRPSTAKLRPR